MKYLNAARKYVSNVFDRAWRALPQLSVGAVGLVGVSAANADALADIAAAADYAAVKTGMGTIGVEIALVLVVVAGIAWLLMMIKHR